MSKDYNALYKKDLFEFATKDEYQMFMLIIVLITIFRYAGFVDADFFKQVFIVAIGFAFGDNTISTIFRK